MFRDWFTPLMQRAIFSTADRSRLASLDRLKDERMNDDFGSKGLDRIITRAVSVGFAGIGGLLGLANLRYLFPGATMMWNGKPTDDLLLRVIACVLPFVMSVLGVLMYRAHPPRKD